MYLLGDENTALLARISLLMNGIHDGTMCLDDALKSSTISQIQVALDNWRASMLAHRTAKLWMQYQRILEILRAFIRSVRTGDWNLYLKSLCDMHPYLAAAGHNNYTKSLALFYSQNA